MYRDAVCVRAAGLRGGVFLTCAAAAGLVSLSLEGGAGGGSGGASSGGGGGGGDGGDGEEEAGGNWRVLLAKAGREAQSIPNDVLSALNDGRANAEVLER